LPAEICEASVVSIRSGSPECQRAVKTSQ
jgi:hypothetical protein